MAFVEEPALSFIYSLNPKPHTRTPHKRRLIIHRFERNLSLSSVNIALAKRYQQNVGCPVRKGKTLGQGEGKR